MDEGVPTGQRAAGLGILGMRERAAALAGNFCFEPAPGEGTRVSIRLPVAGALALARRGNLVPITILLADDHAILRQGLRRILESYPDFQVVAEAATGVQAVKLAREFQPDIAIIDVAMPDLNGLEATAQILKRVPRTAVLILSMYNDARYVSRALKAAGLAATC